MITVTICFCIDFTCNSIDRAWAVHSTNSSSHWLIIQSATLDPLRSKQICLVSFSQKRSNCAALTAPNRIPSSGEFSRRCCTRNVTRYPMVWSTVRADHDGWVTTHVSREPPLEPCLRVDSKRIPPRISADFGQAWSSFGGFVRVLRRGPDAMVNSSWVRSIIPPPETSTSAGTSKLPSLIIYNPTFL